MSRSAGSRGDSRSGETPPGTPRWVKVSALVALLAVAVLVVIMLVSGGEHGPGLHAGAAGLTGTNTAMIS